MRQRRVRRNALLALCLSLELTGCTSWRLENVGPAEVIVRDHPAKIRVRGPHMSQVVLYWPEVHGDSLLGRHRGNARVPDRFVALADVASVATSHVDAGKTAAIGLGIVAALGITALIAAASIDGPFDNWGR